MATGTLPRLDRSTKAAGIVSRQECELQDTGKWRVRDTQTGSGKWHIATATDCDCWDFRRRCVVCKHIGAVRHEERMLAQYAAAWDARAQAQRPAGPQCPDCGGRLTSQTFYIGGKGYQAFLVCTRDAQHRALPA